MNQEEKHLHKIYWVGERSFLVYHEYYEQMGESYPVYPDFEEHPEYTREGRPFVTAVQERCPFAKARAPSEKAPGDCSDYEWFYREHTPYDPIGICLCDARRCTTNEGKEQRE